MIGLRAVFDTWELINFIIDFNKENKGYFLVEHVYYCDPANMSHDAIKGNTQSIMAFIGYLSDRCNADLISVTEFLLGS